MCFFVIFALKYYQRVINGLNSGLNLIVYNGLLILLLYPFWSVIDRNGFFYLSFISSPSTAFSTIICASASYCLVRYIPSLLV